MSNVNHPKHYNEHPSGVECIDIIEDMNFNVGNAIKYLWRAGLKDDLIQDLQKAEWYIRREIERQQKRIKLSCIDKASVEGCLKNLHTVSNLELEDVVTLQDSNEAGKGEASQSFEVSAAADKVHAPDIRRGPVAPRGHRVLTLKEQSRLRLPTYDIGIFVPDVGWLFGTTGNSLNYIYCTSLSQESLENYDKTMVDEMHNVDSCVTRDVLQPELGWRLLSVWEVKTDAIFRKDREFFTIEGKWEPCKEEEMFSYVTYRTRQPYYRQ